MSNVLPMDRHPARAPPGTTTRRAGEGSWQAFAPGVTIKLLRQDAGSGRMTALLRMRAGATLPGHHHEQTEECMILEGSLLIGRHVLRAGDLHVAAAGTAHAPAASPGGVLLLLHARAG